MKKFVLIIVAMIILFENQDHPFVAPTIQKIKQALITDAQSRHLINDTADMITQLNTLHGKLIAHEMNYVTAHITDRSQAQNFWDAYCQDTSLLHIDLTQYAKNEICAIISPYIKK